MPRPKPGEKTPGSGRKKGTPNKATAAIKAHIDAIFDQPEGWGHYARQFADGKLDAGLMVRLLEWRIGKPKTSVEVTKLPPVLVIDELSDE